MSKSKNFLLGELTAQTRDIVKVLEAESEIGAVLVATSFLDSCLNTLLRTQLRSGKTTERILNPQNGLLGTYAGKCEIAYCFGLIEKDIFNELILLGEIRNIFAHDHLECTFSNQEISTRCKKLKLPKMHLDAHTDASNFEDLKKYMENPRSCFSLSASRLSNLLIMDGMSNKWHGNKCV